MSATTTAVAKTNGDKLRGLLNGEQFKLALMQSLPKNLKPDRFVRVALTAMTKNPLLAEADQASFFQQLLTLSQLGLEPDGRRAHLIPFRNNKRQCVEVQLIIDYKGYVELIMNTGLVSMIHADVVCENDDFEWDRGEVKKHKINLREPRGNVYAAYAFIRFKDGTEKADCMTREEVEAIRRRSRAGNAGPWVTDWNEMAKKTVFRRCTKWVKLSPEEREAIEKDDTQFDHQQFNPAKATFGAVEQNPFAAAALIDVDAPTETAIETEPTPEPEPEPAPPPAEPPPPKQFVNDKAKLVDWMGKMKVEWPRLQPILTRHADIYPFADSTGSVAELSPTQAKIIFLHRADLEAELDELPM